MSDRFGQIFREEAYEILGRLESTLIDLEVHPNDQETIGRVFRDLHTIKGSGAMAGFAEVAAFTHEVETVFDRVRNRDLAVTRELVSLALAARDQIKAMIDGAPLDEAQAGRVIAALHDLASAQGGAPGGVEFEEPALPAAKSLTYRIRFRPAADIFLRGLNPLFLLGELRRLGKCLVRAHVEAVPTLEELDPESCYLSWEALLTTDKGEDAIKDVFVFVEGDSELSIGLVDDDPSGPAVERGAFQAEGTAAIWAATPPKAGRRPEPQSSPRPPAARNTDAAFASIRVRSEKLDTLVDLIGELVTVQARLSQTVRAQNDPEFFSIAEELERLTWDLRDQVLNIRMVPIGTSFNTFDRLVRDLSAELGKEVVLRTSGGATELDKTVIDRLHDPLVHLIRNCIDHGIEAPEAREAAGKSSTGAVSLSASHSGAHVVLVVKDDGAGLDLEALRRRALAMGLHGDEVDFNERDLCRLIFIPGVSTAEELTSVSGRGVGMDVVKGAIDALRGTIEVASRPSAGTTFTIRLPLTLAIIDGLLVKVGLDKFILPLAAVEECMELKNDPFGVPSRRSLIKVRDEIVPYVRLRERFDLQGIAPEIEQIVIAHLDGRRVGFVVDHVIGEHQTVIKSLSRIYREVKGVSGATVLGDGTLALILDIPQLIELEETAER